MALGKKYIGYREIDFSTAWAKFFTEKMPPIQPQVLNGLEKSPFEAGKLPRIENARRLAEDGYGEVETGYSIEKSGEIRVAILTEMPRVLPTMWDWWFGWHGCRDNRYKLWHPKSHQAAKWLDGKDDEAYIGRTSMIQEYIGKTFTKASIRFIAPEEFGLISNQKSVFICARVGYTNFPLNFGWLLHQVRKTADGAEMRSRFWIGGEHIEIRRAGIIFKGIAKVLQKIVPAQRQLAKDLLIHCAEEMNHLAQFLPEIYKKFNQ
jgi:hypothetical protein